VLYYFSCQCHPLDSLCSYWRSRSNWTACIYTLPLFRLNAQTTHLLDTSGSWSKAIGVSIAEFRINRICVISLIPGACTHHDDPWSCKFITGTILREFAYIDFVRLWSYMFFHLRIKINYSSKDAGLSQTAQSRKTTI
jgi:hypothetical protein